MRWQWIFALVFSSLAGELVLGSMFPNSNQNGPVQAPQQEDKWPAESIASLAKEVIVPTEAKIYSHALRVEPAKDVDLESGHESAKISPKITVDDQDSDIRFNSENNAELETEKLLPSD